MKIKKGNKYKCFKSFVLGGATIFTESEEYYASNDNELICNDGDVCEIKYDSFILNHFLERPTEEEYEKALEIIRAYENYLQSSELDRIIFEIEKDNEVCLNKKRENLWYKQIINEQ